MLLGSTPAIVNSSKSVDQAAVPASSLGLAVSTGQARLGSVERWSCTLAQSSCGLNKHVLVSRRREGVSLHSADLMCDPSASCVMHNIHLENEQN